MKMKKTIIAIKEPNKSKYEEAQDLFDTIFKKLETMNFSQTERMNFKNLQSQIKFPFLWRMKQRNDTEIMERQNDKQHS